MKKSVLVAIILTIVVAGYIAVRPDKATNSVQTAPSKQNNAADVSAKPDTNPNTKGAYLDYNPNIIANTSGIKIIFFHAPWCPQCRALDSDIKSKGVPPGVNIIKTDYDSNQALRQKYGVTIQTTLVRVDDQGNLIQKYVAYDQPNLESVKQHLLQ